MGDRSLSILDAQALVAFFTGEPAMDDVSGLLRERSDTAQITAVNLAEVIDVLVRVRRRPRKIIDERIAWLQSGGLEVIPVTEAGGRRAADVRARHYHRTDCPISLADCVALAAAQLTSQSLATADPRLASTARAESVGLIPLPDSRGVRP